MSKYNQRDLEIYVLRFPQPSQYCACAETIYGRSRQICNVPIESRRLFISQFLRVRVGGGGGGGRGFTKTCTRVR